MNRINPNRANRMTRMERHLPKILSGGALIVASVGLGAYLIYGGNDTSSSQVTANGSSPTYIVNDGGTLNQYFGANSINNDSDAGRNDNKGRKLEDMFNKLPALSSSSPNLTSDNNIVSGDGVVKDNYNKNRGKLGTVSQVFPIDGTNKKVFANVNLDDKTVQLGKKSYTLDGFLKIVENNLDGFDDPDYNAYCNLAEKIEKRAGSNYMMRGKKVSEYIVSCPDGE
ncbi:MAG: hypothetical protein KC550_00640 [Nanoarchaeota archaeon]|nr:hypothetical protein [Nanoarchaeota archaeon]